MDYESAIKQTLVPVLAYPSQLKVVREQVRGRLLFGLGASQDDIGRIIGKSGSMIKALQLIFREIGRVNNQHVWISVETPASTQPRLDQKHPKWNGQENRVELLEQFNTVLRTILVESIQEPVSLEVRDVGNHALFILCTTTQIPKDLLAAFQTYAKAYGKSNGVWITIENDYP